MVNFPGRNRRRRVLKEEVLAASNNHASLRASTDGGASDAPRYSDAAGVENHPQITDFVPRRYGTIAMLVVMGAGTTAVMSALDYFAQPLAAAIGVQNTSALELTSYGSLASWFAAVVLLVASGACLLTYSIRRHRIDDFRGRYRVWLGAAIACLLMSMNSVTGLHQVAADALGHLTGWTALRSGAVWWLMLAGLPVAWIGLRALLDTRECRVAAGLLSLAVACYMFSTVSYLGVAVSEDLRVRSITTGSSLMIGHWLALASVVAYARFVVLDAQGLIERRQTTTKRTARAESDEEAEEKRPAASSKSAPSILSAAGYSRSLPQAAKTPADSSRWVDGSRPERKRYNDEEEDDEDSSGGGKISKADRKKLRKLKTESRAA